MKLIIRLLTGVIFVIILLLIGHQLDNFTPEAKHTKNDVKLTYTMIAKDVETTSTVVEDGKTVKHQVSFKHNNGRLSAETPLQIASGDEVKYQYIDHDQNKIKIIKVIHFD